MDPIRQAATYTRISQDRTGLELGVTRQREDIEALARQRGIPVVARFEDNDISAAKGKHRPDYTALMAAVERGEVDAVVAWSLDRLWRNNKERATAIELLAKHRVPLILVKGSDMDLGTAGGRMLAGLLGEVATYESGVKSERQVREMRQRVQRGVWSGGPRTFGYTPEGTVIPAEAREVKDAFDAFLAGATISGIAAGLNARGVLNRNGAPWRHNAVRVMLRNARYAGLRLYEGEEHPGAWDAIVEPETWRAAKAILDDDGRTTSPGPARKWLLSGIARCGVCNDGTTVTSAQRGGKGAPHIYKCRRQAHLGRASGPIDDLVRDYVVARLSLPDARELLVDRDAPDMAELHARANALRAKLDGIAADYADDLITRSQMHTLTARTREQLAETEALMAHPQRAHILGDLVAADDVAAAWKALPLDRRRAVVDVLMTVTLLPAKHAPRVFFDDSTVRVEPKR